MHALVGRAWSAAPAGGARDRDLGDPRLPGHPLARRDQELPGDLRRYRRRDGHDEHRVVGLDPDPRPSFLGLPAPFQVVDPAGDLADPVVRLGVRLRPERGRVQPRRIDACLAEQRVSLDPRPLDDIVLEESMDDDDIGAKELLASGDALDDRLAVMDDELEV